MLAGACARHAGGDRRAYANGEWGALCARSTNNVKTSKDEAKDEAKDGESDPGSHTRDAGQGGSESQRCSTRRAGSAPARIYARLSGRLPPRIVAPFLLFWCLGSLVLGHELASLPFASFAAAVTRPLQATLQVQGVFPHASSSDSQSARHQQGASQRLTVAATGLLGRKIPVVRRAPGAKARARSKLAGARGVSRDLSASTRLAQPSPWGGAWPRMSAEFGDLPGWQAFPWDDDDSGNVRAPWGSAGRFSPGAFAPCEWMGPYVRVIECVMGRLRGMMWKKGPPLSPGWRGGARRKGQPDPARRDSPHG